MWRWGSPLIVNALVGVVGAVFVLVRSLVLLLWELCLIVTVADLRAVGAGALAAVGVDHGLCGGGAVLGVVHLSAQTIHTHTSLGRHLVGAHLQGDGGVVHRRVRRLLVVDVSAGPGGRHARLGGGERKVNMMEVEIIHWPEMAKVHTSFTQVEVQILVFKNTLVKVKVLTSLLK